MVWPCTLTISLWWHDMKYIRQEWGGWLCLPNYMVCDTLSPYTRRNRIRSLIVALWRVWRRNMITPTFTVKIMFFERDNPLWYLFLLLLSYNLSLVGGVLVCIIDIITMTFDMEMSVYALYVYRWYCCWCMYNHIVDIVGGAHIFLTADISYVVLVYFIIIITDQLLCRHRYQFTISMTITFIIMIIIVIITFLFRKK